MISPEMKKSLGVRVSPDSTFTTDEQGRRISPDGACVVGGTAKTTIRKHVQQKAPQAKPDKKAKKPRKNQDIPVSPQSIPVTIQVAGARFTAEYQQVHQGEALLVLCSKQPVPFMPQEVQQETMTPCYSITYNGRQAQYVYTGLKYPAHGMLNILMLEVTT